MNWFKRATLLGTPRTEWQEASMELIIESLEKELGRHPTEDEIKARVSDSRWENSHSGEIQKRMLQKYWNFNN